MLEEAVKRLEEFKELEAKWPTPFPMGVFGTLRLDCGNDPLMGSPEDGSRTPHCSRWGRTIDCKYASHHKAFMPHFTARGLSISFSHGQAAVFEVFTYKPEDWKKMIGPVDGLEGFTPGNGRDWGYWRTLVYLHILPDDYDHKHFEGLYSERVLPIPMEKWADYPHVPCWVYSSRSQNRACRERLGIENSPIIWYGDEADTENNGKDDLFAD
jgi:hypothetical protein